LVLRFLCLLAAILGVVGLSNEVELRDSAENKPPILLGLEARSSVSDFSHLPLVNSFIASLAGTSIPAHL
jgi:hypothetical protein